MGKQELKRDSQTAISQLSREALEVSYMCLFEISLQKTELIKHLEKQLATASTKRIEG